MSLPFNQQWAYWIEGSIAKHMYDALAATGLHFEAQRRSPSNLTEVIELRIDGPDFSQLEANYWAVKVEINMLVATRIEDNLKTHADRRAQVVACLTDKIEILEIDDPGAAVVGCLDRDENVVVENFGQIDPNIEITQSTIEGHYVLDLHS